MDVYVLMQDEPDMQNILGIAATIEECEQQAQRIFAEQLKEWAEPLEGLEEFERDPPQATELVWEKGLGKRLKTAPAPRCMTRFSIRKHTLGKFDDWL